MDGLPTVPGMSPLPGAPAIPQMPNLSSSFLPNPGTSAVPNSPPQTPQPPQPPQLPGISPVNAPSGVSPIAPAGAGFMGALRSNLPSVIGRAFPGASSAPGANAMPAWLQGLQHGQAMNDWQSRLGSAVFGGGMAPGSGVSGYLKNLGGVAASRPAPGPNTLNTPVVGPMLSHIFGPYTGTNNGGSTSTT